MASHSDILSSCLEQAATSSSTALARCVDLAVGSLQLAETQSMKLAEREVLASSWRLMERSKPSWSVQFGVALSAEFAAALAIKAPPIQSFAQSPTPMLAPAAKPHTSANLSLSLVEDSDVKQAIDARRLLQSLMPGLEPTLAELDALISSAQGLPHVTPERNPLRPEVFTRVLQKLMLDTTSDAPMLGLWVRHLAAPLGFEIRQIYQKTTQTLERARVPAARYHYKAQPDTPSRPAPLTQPRTADLLPAQREPLLSDASAFTPPLQPYADLSNGEIRADMLEDFLSHGGGSADHKLAAPYYADVDQELAALADTQHGAPAPAWSDSALQSYQRMPAVNRPQRAVNAASALSEQVWGPYGTSRARSLVRHQLKKQATQVNQALGLDVVRQLVTQVAQDPRLLAPVREAIVALEPSLLRLTLVDPRFFTDERHAGRQLMERVAQRSFKYNDEFSPEFAGFFEGVAKSFNQLNASNAPRAQLFAEALAALEHTWNALDQQDFDKRQQVLQALRFAEERQSTADQIAFDLSARSDLSNVPGKMLDFLFGPWALAMAHARLTDTRNQIDPKGYGSVVPDLVWSVKRDVTLKQPAKLIEMIPGLLDKLHSGLGLLGQDPKENEAFFESLMKLHRPVLKLRRLKSQRDAEESNTAPLEPEEALVSPAERLEKLRAQADAPLWMGRNDLDAAGFEDTQPTAPADLQAADLITETSRETQAAVDEPPVDQYSEKVEKVDTTQPTKEQAEIILQGLQTGHWVDLYSKRQWLRAQLVWESSRATLFMFISHGGQPHSMTKRSCEKLIVQRLLRPVATHGVVAQALDAVALDVAAQSRRKAAPTPKTQAQLVPV